MDIDYFNQESPTDLPRLFAPGFISTNKYEFAGTFSPDGTEYFFTRRPTLNGSENRIYYTRYKDGEWSKTSLAPFSQDAFEFLPSITPNGDKLFFSSFRAKPQNTKYTGNIWFVTKTEQGWSDAKYLEAPLNKKFTMYITATKSDTLYYAAKDDTKRGIYKSECVDGVYQEPEYLPAEINSILPTHPFIAPDESYLLMDTQQKGMGKPEIYISFKDKNDNWIKAINIGKMINLTNTEYAPSVSPDGKYLFFHRRINEKGDIYWVSSKIIDKIKEAVL